jgi:hypothetical protein
MKNLLAAGMTGMLLFAGLPAAAQDAPPPGSHAYCDARWNDMVANHTTGDLTRDGFMDSCLTHRRGAYWESGGTLVYLGLAAVAAGVIILVATQSNNNPSSP